MINTVAGASVSGAGNLGVNMAAGYNNMQSNIGSVADSAFDGSLEDEVNSAGWSEASATVLQGAFFNYYGPEESETVPALIVLDPSDNNYRDRNTVGAITVGGSGNIGVNAAAGAFNVQQNTLAMATTSDTDLSEANAAVIQTADVNRTVVMDSVNRVDGGTFGGNGSSGNIGVNIAAGVGNMQSNALTLASTFGDPDEGAGGGSGGIPTGGDTRRFH